MNPGSVAALVGGIVVVAGIVIFLLARVVRLRRRVSTSEALVIYGSGQTITEAVEVAMEAGPEADRGAAGESVQHRKDYVTTRSGFRIVTGGGTWVKPLIEQTGTLSLEPISITAIGDELKDKDGIVFYADWNGILRIPPKIGAIGRASTMFLDKEPSVIEDVAKQVLVGSMRAVISSMGVHEVHTDRDGFSSRVEDIIADEMQQMGLEVVSLTIQDLYDWPKDREGRILRPVDAQLGYFEALAAKKMAVVRASAQIAAAEESRKAREAVANEERAAKETELRTQTETAARQKDHDVRAAEYRRESQEAQALAENAMALKQAEIDRDIEQRKGAIEVMKQEQAALAAQQAIEVAKRTQQAQVVVPAQAAQEAAVAEAKGASEAMKLTSAASANDTRVTRQAEADGAKAIGEAEAAATKADLLAQAEGEQRLAEARAAQGEVNLRQFAIETLANAQVEMARAYANAMMRFAAQMRVVQIGEGVTGAAGGHPVIDTLMRIPEMASVLNAKAEALSGQSVADFLSQAAELARGASTVPETVSEEPGPTESKPATG
jgi:flotillin